MCPIDVALLDNTECRPLMWKNSLEIGQKMDNFLSHFVAEDTLDGLTMRCLLDTFVLCALDTNTLTRAYSEGQLLPP